MVTLNLIDRAFCKLHEIRRNILDDPNVTWGRMYVERNINVLKGYLTAKPSLHPNYACMADTVATMVLFATERRDDYSHLMHEIKLDSEVIDTAPGLQLFTSFLQSTISNDLNYSLHVVDGRLRVLQDGRAGLNPKSLLDALNTFQGG